MRRITDNYLFFKSSGVLKTFFIWNYFHASILLISLIRTFQGKSLSASWSFSAPFLIFLGVTSASIFGCCTEECVFFSNGARGLSYGRWSDTEPKPGNYIQRRYRIFRTIRRTFSPQNRGGGKSVRLMERRKQIIFSCFLLLKNWCVLWKGVSYGVINTVIPPNQLFLYWKLAFRTFQRSWITKPTFQLAVFHKHTHLTLSAPYCCYCCDSQLHLFSHILAMPN